MENKEENTMEIKKQKKENVPVEIYDGILDHVSGGSESLSDLNTTPIGTTDTNEKKVSNTVGNGVMSGSMLR